MKTSGIPENKSNALLLNEDRIARGQTKGFGIQKQKFASSSPSAIQNSSMVIKVTIISKSLTISLSSGRRTRVIKITLT